MPKGYRYLQVLARAAKVDLAEALSQVDRSDPSHGKTRYMSENGSQCMRHICLHEKAYRLTVLIKTGA